MRSEFKTPTGRRGFTRRELVTSVVLIALLSGGAWLYFRRAAEPPLFRAKQAATQAKVIHGWLMTCAEDHGGAFPKGANANEAYRELFKINAGADEKQFYIPGDAYHKAAPGGEPDGDTGGAPDYAWALETGENAFAYVSGLTKNNDPRLPLIANGFTSQPGVWSKSKNEKGGVFLGRYGVVCRVGGSSVAWDLQDGEWMVKERMHGVEMNIFAPGFFDDANATVVNPL